MTTTTGRRTGPSLKPAASIAGVIAAVLLTGCPLAPGQDSTDTTYHEVWVAVRTDKQPGNGSVTDPFDAGTVEKLDALFEKFRTEYGENLTVHFGPGVYYGDGQWAPLSNWQIRGAGMDVTVFKTKADPNGTGTVGFRAGGYTGGPSGFKISDLTFDFNVPNLRRANRAFVYQRGKQRLVYYFYAANLPQWNAKTTYSRRRNRAVKYRGNEYLAAETSTNKEPGQNQFWSILRPNDAAEVPQWKVGRAYVLGDAVARRGVGYICVTDQASSDPANDPEAWKPLNPTAPDPLIYTNAVFVHARPPGGQHRVERVKAINGHGSSFFAREAFIIGLGGNDCVIEDCVVEQFHGDYSTLIVVNFGQNNAVRGCVVRGNDGLMTMGYGGWACWDTVFESNFATNCFSATNIDSLTSRNVIFRNNVFMNCREVGILVNVSGRELKGPARRYTFPFKGKELPMATSQLDGVFITGNLVQIRAGAPYGAIQVQNGGLRNIVITNNVLRTTSGSGKARAIGVLRAAEHIVVAGNVCDPGMTAAIPAHALCYDNYDFYGNPMPGLDQCRGRPPRAAP